jgi:starvation-inducible outer membrane lipoprotein
MKNKIVISGGLFFLAPGIIFAAVLGGPSGIRQEIKAPEVSTDQAFQTQIDYDTKVAENPATLGGKMAYVQNGQKQAKIELALYSIASSDYKQAGPTGPSAQDLQAEHDRKVQYLKGVVDNPGFLGEKMTYSKARKAEAEKQLKELGL